MMHFWTQRLRLMMFISFLPPFLPSFLLFIILNPHPRTCTGFRERAEGKERETSIQERDTDRLPPTHAPPGMCPDQELNLQPSGVQDNARPTEPPGQGCITCIFLKCCSGWVTSDSTGYSVIGYSQVVGSIPGGHKQGPASKCMNGRKNKPVLVAQSLALSPFFSLKSIKKCLYSHLRTGLLILETGERERGRETPSAASRTHPDWGSNRSRGMCPDWESST